MARHLLKVVFLPNWSGSNPYQKLLMDALSKLDVQVDLANYPKGAFPINKVLSGRHGTDIVHLHWINPLIANLFWNKRKPLIYAKLLLLWLDIVIAKLRGVRIVWTIHNLIAHESPDPEIEAMARRALLRACDKAILHSHGALDKVERGLGMRLGDKAVVIPHGHYAGCYPPAPEHELALRNNHGISPEQRVFLFFGLIRKYKGVETLIQAFRATRNRDIRLIIAGKVEEADLRGIITSSARQDSRIIPILEYIPDNQVGALFSIADMVVFPFERTLTSGSVLLAISMARGLLLTEQARQLEVVDESGAIFYGSTEELTRCLDTVDKATAAALATHNALLSQHYSWENIGERTRIAYES